MLDEKEQKKLYQLCTKISYAYTECYITNQGYILSMDKTKPFVILAGISGTGKSKIVRLFADRKLYSQG